MVADDKWIMWLAVAGILAFIVSQTVDPKPAPAPESQPQIVPCRDLKVTTSVYWYADGELVAVYHCEAPEKKLWERKPNDAEK